ncbi:microtubule-associated protein 70-4-like [Cucurbita maxima]|uniref:Microtubule-associated protein 70-4-like n=1 Tax=Cucurbita maxima TaxID=3661 RepID=A0A6J1I5W3_CUCMA|nr:microtubule-associated protein 70-4-like [Cucurbita maxima]
MAEISGDGDGFLPEDDDMPPIEDIVAPLEAEPKLARQEIAKLQDDNKALDHLTKSKEATLVDAKRTVQNRDLSGRKQNLGQDAPTKNCKAEKLTQTVRELEEAVIVAWCGCSNVVRDYQRKIQEMNEERKTLDRELARAKHRIGPHSVISSIEDESRKEIDSNNGFSLSDCEESIVLSLAIDPIPPPQFATASPPQAQSQVVVELVPEKPLPEKGKLLETVMKAGPLLVAGPLPEWRHPPLPLESSEFPPVTVSFEAWYWLDINHFSHST